MSIMDEEGRQKGQSQAVAAWPAVVRDHPKKGGLDIGNASVNKVSTLGALLERTRFSELNCKYDSDAGIAWVNQTHAAGLCYTPELLAELLRLHLLLKQGVASDLSQTDLRYLVWGSEQKEIFNLGGDLSLFLKLIEDRDVDALAAYARQCVDACYGHYENLKLPIISIAMVEGYALGGGFEAVLSSDVIVAEEDARFGFPEILFGLFPAMGAYTYLTRRISPADTEALIRSGKTYTAQELHEMKLVDFVTPKGGARAAVLDYVRRTERNRVATVSLHRARRRVDQVTYEEMIDITGYWVEAAMALDSKHIRRMASLARSQQQRHSELSEISRQGLPEKAVKDA